MKKLLVFILTIFMIALVFPKNTKAESNVPSKVVMDKTLLVKPIVAVNEVEIDATIYDSENKYCYGFEVEFSITKGNEFAEIVNNKLLVNAAGEFTIRCTVKGSLVYEEYTTTAYTAKLSDIILLNKFEGITVYTQPIKLQTSLNVSLKKADGKATQSNDSHYLSKFRVVSGPAEIFEDCYLRILGVGEVVVEASSIFDDNIKVTKTFTVTNPDEGKIVDDDTKFYQGDVVKKTTEEKPVQEKPNKQENDGCSLSISTGIALLTLTIPTILIAFRKKENN